MITSIVRIILLFFITAFLFGVISAIAKAEPYSPCAPWELFECPKVCIFTKEYRSNWDHPCRTDRPLKEAYENENDA